VPSFVSGVFEPSELRERHGPGITDILKTAIARVAASSRDDVEGGEDYEGSYGRVAAFARTWKAERQRPMQASGRGTFVPLAFEHGETFQFDWSEDRAVLGGERTKLLVAHFKLSYSRAFIVRAYPLQTREMLLDAHNHAFRVLGGVPRGGIYDNMRTAVDRIGRSKDRHQEEKGAPAHRLHPKMQHFCASCHSSPPLAVRATGAIL
jgi:transposase